jgi:hypothetical protein
MKARSHTRCAIPTCRRDAAVALTIERPVDVDVFAATFAEYVEYSMCPACARALHTLLDRGRVPATAIVAERPIPTQRTREHDA